MAVAFASSGTANSGNTSPAGTISTPFNVTINIGTPGANSALVVFASVCSNSAGAVSSLSCTWNSVSMFLPTGASTFNADGLNNGVFGLINPATGSNTLSVSWGGGGTSNVMICWATFTGVDQSANSTSFINGVANDYGNTAATHTQSITTVSGNATLMGWMNGQVNSTGTSPAVDQEDNGPLAAYGTVSELQHRLSSGTSDSFTVTMAAQDFQTNTGISIKASAGTDVLASQIWI